MNNVQTPKPPTPTAAEWKRFESAMDTILKAPPAHRKAKPAKKKPRSK
jgi:hypothetical protein